MNEVIDIIDRLGSLEREDGVPRNMREKIRIACKALSEEETSLAIRINRSLQELDDVSTDMNTPSDIKTILWSITSELECIKH